MRNPFKKKTDRLIIISENDFHSRLLPVDYHVKTVLNDSGSITSIIKQGKLIEGNNQTSRSENLELPINQARRALPMSFLESLEYLILSNMPL